MLILGVGLVVAGTFRRQAISRTTVLVRAAKMEIRDSSQWLSIGYENNPEAGLVLRREIEDCFG